MREKHDYRTDLSNDICKVKVKQGRYIIKYKVKRCTCAGDIYGHEDYCGTEYEEFDNLTDAKHFVEDISEEKFVQEYGDGE